MRTRYFAFAALITLGGCVPAEFIVLRDPKTGVVVECHTDSGSSFFPIAQTEIDNSATRNCAKGFENAGYVREN